jgi:ABC-2 type transport system ATP-binding protein
MSTVLQVDNVRVEYGSFVALPGLSMQLEAGNLLGLIGPNGAGKTTILKATAGLLRMEAGSIRVLGEEVNPGTTLAHTHVGFAPDAPPVYEALSVRQFLQFIGRAYRMRDAEIDDRIGLLLEQLWLADRRDAKIKSLSRGMRQRLTVARTLLPDPPLVLLDEPASGLDPAGRVQFRGLLRSLSDQGKALIVSSHILADLHEYCTHIGIMQGGKLLQFGTVAQVVGESADNRSLYKVVLARATPDTSRVMEAIAGLTHLEIQGRNVSFEYEHDDQRAAELLARLLREGLPVSSFAAVAHDLEQAYLRTGIRQVD